MENEDKSTFSLDDDEIVEEEVIDRDEEYDDDSEDDEEYDDEEYDDDDDYYDDEEEDIDDGYSDDYYDDRLNKVLDEIAELKRNMTNAPSTVVQQQPYVQQPPIVPPPQYVYQPSAPPAGSEVVMYNEISRLRDELAKNQSSLEMQKELQRIKDDMARDQKFAESQYNAEIKRLQDKIEELLKNAQSPQGDSTDSAALGDESKKNAESSNSNSNNNSNNNSYNNVDFDKLLSINEAILRSMHDTDARLRNEISQLRKRVDEFPSAEEFSHVVESVKKAAETSDGVNEETLAKLNADIEAIRTILDNLPEPAPAPEQPAPAPVPVQAAAPAPSVVVVNPDKEKDVTSSELLRQLYEIKNVLGSSSDAVIEHMRTLLDLINELKKVDFDVHSQEVSFKDKLAGVYAYGQKLVDSGDQDAIELIEAVNNLISELVATPVTRNIFADAAAFCSEKAIASVSNETRESAERYFNICDRVKNPQADVAEALPDLITEKNKLENNAYEAENTELFNDIIKALTDEDRDEKLIRDKIAELAALKVSDIISFPTIAMPKEYNAAQADAVESIFAKLAELKTAIEESHAETKSAIEQGNAETKSAIEQGNAETKSAIEQGNAETKTAIEQGNAETKSAIEQGNADTKSAIEQSNADTKTAIEQSNAETKSALAASTGEKPAKAENSEPDPDQAMRDEAIDAMLDALEELKSSVGTKDDDTAILTTLGQIRSDYLDVSQKLLDISEQITDQPTPEPYTPVMTEDEKNAAIEDLQYIRTKLDEQSALIAQIDELRNDIQGISGSLDFSEQFSQQLADITTQFDKLYEDISSVVIESEANIINHITDNPTLNDALNAAKTEIVTEVRTIGDMLADSPLNESVEQLKADAQDIKDSLVLVNDGLVNNPLNESVEQLKTDAQDIKDSLVLVNDSIVNTPLNDAVDQLRADLSSFADITAANVDASTADRQRLLDDVAYLREQYDAMLADREQTREIINNVANHEDSDKLSAYLDEISARVGALANVPEDAAAARETAATISDNVATIIDMLGALNFADDINAVKDSVNAVLDAVTPINDSVNAVLDAVAPINENVNVVLDTVAPLNENVSAVLDAVAPINENISAVLDNVAPINENVIAVLDAVAPINENVSAVLDAVAPVNENVGALLDAVAPINENVGAVLDVVTPLSDDVLATRDSANAALDALSSLGEQLNSLLDKLDEENAVAADENIDEEDTAFDENMEQIRDDLNTILDTLPLMPQSDDLIVARDNTYAILDALSNVPNGDDVSAIRESVAAVLDSINALSDKIGEQADAGSSADDIAAIRLDTDALISAIPEGFADDWNERQSKFDDGLADIKYIKQKFEEFNSNEEVGDSLANVIQDIGLVLDKLESFEQTLVTNKQEIIDSVSGIREEVHINELHDSVTATGVDDETRDKLVAEISEIRERLASLENASQSSSDANITALDSINTQLADIQSSLTAQGGSVDSDGNAAIYESIEQIKEMLQSPVALDAVADDIADIKARLDNGISVSGDGLSGEGVQSIIDELALIKEKIDADSAYDTVTEILSLRDDVKAARIVDQNDVSGELESIKNELASLASGNILDEIRALREDISNIAPNGGGDTVAQPTTDELNLVLNEIVSLRDEVFAFRDEVMANGAAPVESEATDDDGQIADEVESDEDGINLILDELTALRADQGTITDNIDELKDIISRRTTLATDGDSTDSEAVTAASNELNVVLDEIINLKNDIAGIEVPADRINALSEQVEGLRAAVENLGGAPATVTEKDATDISVSIAALAQRIDDIEGALDSFMLTLASDTNTVDIVAKLDKLTEDVNDIKAGGASTVAAADENGAPIVTETLSGKFEELHAEMDEIKAAVDELAPQDVTGEIAKLRAEVQALREENEQLRNDNAAAVAAELAELRNSIHDMAVAPTVSASGDTSYAALIDEIKSLKDEVAAAKSATIDSETLQAIRDALTAQTASAGSQLGEELGEIRDEIAQLRSLTTVTAESGSAAEVAAIRADIAELRHALGSNDSMYGLAEDVTNIRDDVRTLKDEPDLGVMNEILALREEFQTLREEIEDVKRVAAETDRKSDDAILTEVQSLRDQLFAISMANVNDSRSGETNYESYNNLILDELGSLREQIETAGSSEELRAVSEEIAQIRAALDGRDAVVAELSDKVAKLADDATNSKILEELDSLRTELANQRDADLTTLNFMSEMAHLLERQNSYIAQNTGSKITDELESLKAELASTDAVAEEVAKLRAAMTQTGSNAPDNDAILSALSDLREELAKEEKPSRENELILQEIARLRDEITALADRNATPDVVVADEELSESLSDLKNQLNEIAGIVEPEKKPAQKRTAAKKSSGSSKSSSSGSKSGGSAKSSGAKRSSGGKKSTGTKSNKLKPAPVETSEVVETPIVETTDLEAIIDEQTEHLGGGDENSLNPHLPNTQDVADQLDKLAQKVANKLVIDQLVEQLGSDGVTDEQVEAVLNDLPEELTTVALDEQSNQVRRLANQLVIKKLRDRLNGKNSDDDNN